jgi:hypothetical protein
LERAPVKFAARPFIKEELTLTTFVGNRDFMNFPRISEAEGGVMEVAWQEGPVASAAVGSFEVSPEGFKARRVKVEKNQLTGVIFRAEMRP